jgi:hypothetical protein
VYAMAGPAGLQLLSLGLLAGALGILSRMAPGTPSAWTVLLMGAVTMGTYQLQLPRNAMFSLVMYIRWFSGLARGAVNSPDGGNTD